MSPHPLQEKFQDRKDELVMDKHLRACRVNIIPRDRGYLSEDESYAPPTRARPRPHSVTPCVAALRNTESPVALRYWNQCRGTTSEEENENRWGKESKVVPGNSLSYSDTKPYRSAQCKVDAKPRLENAMSKVPDITNRVRSESLPRTVRRFKVSATVSPSPELKRKVTTKVNEEDHVQTNITTTSPLPFYKPQDSSLVQHQQKENINKQTSCMSDEFNGPKNAFQPKRTLYSPVQFTWDKQKLSNNNTNEIHPKLGEKTGNVNYQEKSILPNNANYKIGYNSNHIRDLNSPTPFHKHLVDETSFNKEGTKVISGEKSVNKICRGICIYKEDKSNEKINLPKIFHNNIHEGSKPDIPSRTNEIIRNCAANNLVGSKDSSGQGMCFVKSPVMFAKHAESFSSQNIDSERKVEELKQSEITKAGIVGNFNVDKKEIIDLTAFDKQSSNIASQRPKLQMESDKNVNNQDKQSNLLTYNILKKEDFMKNSEINSMNKQNKFQFLTRHVQSPIPFLRKQDQVSTIGQTNTSNGAQKIQNKAVHTDFPSEDMNKKNKSSQMNSLQHQSKEKLIEECENIVRESEEKSLEELIKMLSIKKKTKLSINMFNELPSDVKKDVLTDLVQSLPGESISPIFCRLSEESVNEIIPSLFLKASDDVKLSLILDCLPKLSVQKILKDLNESEKEMRKESLRKMTRSLASRKN